jgi:O-antigen/teichoic acid export membrane protein
MGTLRGAGAMPWLGRRAAYTLGAPVLTLAGAFATVAAPLLLDPTRFGDYVLLLSIFQYACALDLGLSQLTDKSLAARGGEGSASMAELVWSRLAVAAGVLLLAVPLASALARPGGELTAGNLLIAAAGGVAFMLSNGPVALYRAGSQVWEFTFAALSMQAGLSVPRLAGLVLGGVTGCFAALLAFYALTAALLNQPFAAALCQRPSARAVARTLGAALPLFAFSALWLLYLTANRWISLALTDAEGFGLFAFGANLVVVGIGVLSTVGQVHYPKHLAGAGEEGAQARLGLELLRLLAVASAGTLAGVLACRYAIPVVFPKFAAAAEPSAALMASGIPLGLAGWLMPLVVAASGRPWRDAVAVFAVSFAVLGAGMAGGDALAGIVGQAWGCALTSLVLPAAQLALLVRGGMLGRARAVAVLGAAAGGMGLDVLAWMWLFPS